MLKLMVNSSSSDHLSQHFIRLRNKHSKENAMRPHHRSACIALGALSLIFGLNVSHAQEFFRIGTGGAAGTYYPVGVMVANAVSVPKKLVATAQITNGSIGNVKGIEGDYLESGFSQSDVATWAYTGSMAFKGKPPVKELRLIATLYPESLHIVVKQGAGIVKLQDLKGKRVALDERASGTFINAQMVLNAFGLKETDLKADYIKADQAAEKLKKGDLDAFFYMGGAPAKPISELIAAGEKIELLNLRGEETDKLLAMNTYFSSTMIAADTYKGMPSTQTLAVSAQWVTSAKVDNNLVYDMTKALFSEETQKRFQTGHPKGKLITAKTAVLGAGIPFHPGAQRYYKEMGLIK
jgi:uncharacterized protein